MDPGIPDATYTGWLNRWRKWKYLWLESTEPVVQFDIRFICREKKLSEEFYGDLSSYMSDRMDKSRIQKNGTIRVHTPYMTPAFSELEILKIPNGEKIDGLGIVTIRLNMFSRKDILVIVKIIEDMGHGVIHNGGIVFSSVINEHIQESSVKNKLPHRDEDPIWDYI